MSSPPRVCWSRRYPLLAASLLLAACATQRPAPILQPTPPHPAEPTPAPAPTTPQPLPPAKANQIPQQFGGYYQDDGPIMEVPYDLDALPEPVPKPEPLNRFANKPYAVLGQNYTPLTPTTPYSEEGIASWYGRKFNGKNTASGEPYDMFKLTAAHPTLPIPSYARVTNLENGKSVVVRINDRGPFHKSRVMDMSYAAAYRLGYNNKGSARVRVEAILPGAELATLASLVAAPVQLAALPSPTSPASSDMIEAIADSLAAAPRAASTPAGTAAVTPIAESGSPNAATASVASAAPLSAANLGTSTTEPTRVAGIWLQLAAFGSEAAADTFRAKLSNQWQDSRAQPAVVVNGKLWRVRVGPFATEAEANQAAAKLASTLAVKPLLVH